MDFTRLFNVYSNFEFLFKLKDNLCRMNYLIYLQSLSEPKGIVIIAYVHKLLT